MRFARFLAAITTALLVDGALTVAVDGIAPGYSLVATLAAIPPSLWLAFRLNEAGAAATLDDPHAFSARRLRPTIAIAFLTAPLLHGVLSSHLDGINPLASYGLAGIAALCYGIFGYLRFFRR